MRPRHKKNIPDTVNHVYRNLLLRVCHSPEKSLLTLLLVELLNDLKHDSGLVGAGRTFSSTSTQESSAPPASTGTHSSSLVEPLLGVNAELLWWYGSCGLGEEQLLCGIVQTVKAKQAPWARYRPLESECLQQVRTASTELLHHSTPSNSEHTEPSNVPSRRLKHTRPSTRHLLPWVCDAPKSDNISLDVFIEIITKEDDGCSSEVKNVLIHWDRGDLDRGDQAKLKEMEINSNVLFAHALDSQEWFHLGEAAWMMGVEMTTQAELDEMTDTEREYKLGAMRHDGAGDSDLTVCVTAEVILLRMAELNVADGRCRKINGKYCFLGLDLVKSLSVTTFAERRKRNRSPSIPPRQNTNGQWFPPLSLLAHTYLSPLSTAKTRLLLFALPKTSTNSPLIVPDLSKARSVAISQITVEAFKV
ncbi:hypothetical protein KCU91_g70, partial [Aureobasidium melanogenum]